PPPGGDNPPPPLVGLTDDDGRATFDVLRTAVVDVKVFWGGEEVHRFSCAASTAEPPPGLTWCSRDLEVFAAEIRVMNAQETSLLAEPPTITLFQGGVFFSQATYFVPTPRGSVILQTHLPMKRGQSTRLFIDFL